MPRPRPRLREGAPSHWLAKYGLPNEDRAPPSPTELPTPVLSHLWVIDDEFSEQPASEDQGASETLVNGQEDGTTDSRETASMEADADSAEPMKEPPWDQEEPERIVKALMGELVTRLDAHDKTLIASMSLQLQEVQHAIMRKLDAQEMRISTVQHRLEGPVTDDVSECLSPALRQGSKDSSASFGSEDTGASNPNNVSEMEQKADSSDVHQVWKREDTPPDLEEADEHHRRASVAHSASQRTESFDDNGPARETRIRRMVKSTMFESVSMVVIMTNAFFVGLQTELALVGTDEQDSIAVFGTNVVYTVIFSIELSLRVYTSGWGYFCDKANWKWNCMDTFTVVASVFEMVLGFVVRFGGKSASVQGLSQFRVLRVLRIVNLLRGLKIARLIKSIRALRTLVHQILFTIKSMMWAMFLLFLIIYLFAVSFTQAANMYRLDEGWISLQLEEHGNLLLHKYWSSLPRSMFTLFLAITGGISWDEAAQPLSDVGTVWVGVFLAYVCFAELAVLNVITGYFCQSAVEGAALDPELVAQKVLASKSMYTDRIREIFAEMDADDSGCITFHEFEEHLEDDHTLAYFDSLGIDASDVWTLFKLMDADSGHEIDMDEFTSGCLRLRGGATSLDLAKLAYDHSYLVKRLGKFMARTDRKLSELAQAQARSSSPPGQKHRGRGSPGG